MFKLFNFLHSSFFAQTSGLHKRGVQSWDIFSFPCYFYVKWHLIGLCGPLDYACYYSSCLLPSFCIAPFLSVTFHFVLHYVLFNNMRYFFLYLYLKAISIYLGREFLKHCYLLQPLTILQARNHLEKTFFIYITCCNWFGLPSKTFLLWYFLSV